MDALLTPKEVANVLKLKARTVTDHRVLDRLGLRPVKIGHVLRFRRKDVEKLIEGSLKPAPKAGRGARADGLRDAERTRDGERELCEGGEEAGGR